MFALTAHDSTECHIALLAYSKIFGFAVRFANVKYDLPETANNAVQLSGSGVLDIVRLDAGTPPGLLADDVQGTRSLDVH